jgi:hypothetical protein
MTLNHNNGVRVKQACHSAFNLLASPLSALTNRERARSRDISTWYAPERHHYRAPNMLAFRSSREPRGKGRDLVRPTS